MGIDYLVCENCGDAFPDAQSYVSCDGCGICWCSDDCASEEGFNMPKKLDDDGDEIDDWENASCGHCRGEIEERVQIPKSEYDQLISNSNKLSALEQAGVDNWEGYPCAMDLLEDMEE